MKIIAFAEQRNNRFRKTAFEVVRAAKTVGDQLSAEVTALIVGGNVFSIAGEVGAYGAAKAIVVEDSRLENYSNTAYAKVVAEIIRQESAEMVFFPASSLGKDLSPRVSVKIDAGLAAECTALRVENGIVIATRPVYAGKGMIDLRVKSAVKIFSLRPNVFSAGAPSAVSAIVEKRSVPLTDDDFGAVAKEIKATSGKKGCSRSRHHCLRRARVEGPGKFFINRGPRCDLECRCRRIPCRR